MQGYEYIRISFDFGDLSELCGLASNGWRVVSVVPMSNHLYNYWALLERPLPKE